MAYSCPSCVMSEICHCSCLVWLALVTLDVLMRRLYNNIIWHEKRLRNGNFRLTTTQNPLTVIYRLCHATNQRGTCMILSGHTNEGINILKLVFSKCFRAGFYTFSQLKFKVNKGTNSCNLCFKTKAKTYLVFVSNVTSHLACHS